MPRLKPKEKCPLHGKVDCCGRSEMVRYAQPKHELKYRMVEPGVREYPDGRQVCSQSALKRRKDRLIMQSPICAACGETFADYGQIELAHRIGKGAGGHKHDSRFSNICLLHALANRMQGSLDLDIYLKEYWKPEHCKS